MIVCQGNKPSSASAEVAAQVVLADCRGGGDNVRMKYFRIEATLNTRLQKPKK
jgi:hypothetical protein